ncbi:uncharacterized protein LOC117297703 [Asterias rubens]|uniref:uncharacterized protein LOC117297703 n=1 Tax=Asterias rubens TaxID=7604 RepID=UPI001455C09F|nr:uncharacterized protein LOC117297703 [Asterias rubens]
MYGPVSTFNAIPLTTDSVYVIRDVAGQIEAGKGLTAEVLTDTLVWPNEVGEVPEEVFGRNDIWWAASGFLVPTKTDGVVALLDAGVMVPATTYDISSSLTDRTKWFYHRVEWNDMNKDGRIDALASRVYLSSNGTSVAEAVWFEHPRFGEPLGQPWTPHVLFSGPDSLFRFEKMAIPGGRQLEVIISAQYFSEKLVVSWVEGLSSSWSDPSKIQHRVIEEVVDNRYFDIELVDLNADGQLDLLVSINSDSNGKLIAYEIPRDFRTGVWRRHLIADGFIPSNLIILEGNGAPGSGHAFYPGPPGDSFLNVFFYIIILYFYNSRYKPLILLTGDDDSNVYVFESTSDNDPSVWTYTMTSIFYAKGTIGGPVVKDIDGDGYAEVFIPAWSEGTLNVYTFKP